MAHPVAGAQALVDGVSSIAHPVAGAQALVDGVSPMTYPVAGAQVAVVVKCAMAPYQSCVYAWVKATGTLRLDPLAPVVGRARRGFAPLNNKCMELRKARRPPRAPPRAPAPAAARPSATARARAARRSWRAAGGAAAGGRTCGAARQGARPRLHRMHTGSQVPNMIGCCYYCNKYHYVLTVLTRPAARARRCATTRT